MSEIQKTASYAAVALVLVALAWYTSPNVSQRTQLVQDQGEPLCPELTDPAVPKALEIFEFDDEVGTMKPLRVHFKNNRWSIPSHNDYPADAEDRLYKTAGAVIGLRKDSFVSEKKDDHAELGVVDPQQEGSATRGWGTRLTLYDESDNKVADVIFGKSIEGKTGFRYVRLAGDDRVYSVKCDDVDLSTRFVDWIDTDLLKVSSFDLDKVVLKDYNVDIRRQRIDDRGTLALQKDAENNWKLDGLKANEETNADKSRELANAVSDLKIVGVRPKPPGLTPDLRTVEGQFVADTMANRGFFVTQSGLVSNDGEAVATTKDGLVYTLRFGGAFIAEGEALTAGKKDEKAKEPPKESPEGKEKKDDKSKKDAGAKDSAPGTSVQEHRFVLVSVSFDESKFPPIPDPAAAADKPKEEAKGEEAKAKDQPADQKAKDAEDKTKEGKADAKAESKAEEKVDPEAKKKADEEAKKKAEEERKRQEDEVKRKREERDKKIADGKKKAKELTDRHANWYYVIANDTFKKIDLTRTDLVKEKEKKEEEKKAEEKKGETKSETPVPPPMKKEAVKEAKPEVKKGDMKGAAPKDAKPEAKKGDTKGGASVPSAAPKDAAKDTKPAAKKEETKSTPPATPKEAVKETKPAAKTGDLKPDVPATAKPKEPAKEVPKK